MKREKIYGPQRDTGVLAELLRRDRKRFLHDILIN